MRPALPSRLNLKHLIFLAAVLHLVVAFGIYLAGKRDWLPGAINNSGIAAFASDSRVYQQETHQLSIILRQQGLMAWLRTPASVHSKIYSVSFAALETLFGPTILSAEPVNLVYYLGTLVLVFLIARQLFDKKTALLSATMFILILPSYLLHTTQLLKDPLFVLLTLALIFVVVIPLTVEINWPRSLLLGLAGGALAGSLWLVRNSMWWIVLSIVAFAIGLSIIQQIRRTKFVPQNPAALILALTLAMGVSYVVKPYWLPADYWAPAHVRADPSLIKADEAKSSNPISRAVGKVSRARAQFIALYPNATSNIDADVEINSTSDLLRYLSRAVLIGFAAPFPNMWFGQGENVGRTGRLVTGLETLLMYGVQILAVMALWRNRNKESVWLLVLVAGLGLVSLGLTVVNLGVLYRLRYLFWLLLVIVAAGAFSTLCKKTEVVIQ